MSVLHGECESTDDVEDRVQQHEDGLTQKDQEIAEILEEMASQGRYDTERHYKYMSNSGKIIEEVSPHAGR